MILASSEQGTVGYNQKSTQMGDANVVAKQNNTTLTKNLDLTDFVAANNKAVSLENVSVNIDNSNDVIIGPVTQFNVNGNVTIVQKGNEEETDTEDIDKRKSSASNSGKGPRSKWSRSILLILSVHWVAIRNSLIACSVVCLIIILTLIIIHKNWSQDEIEDTTFVDPFYNDTVGNYRLLYRKQWGGLPPKKSPVPLHHPVDLIIVSSDFKHFCHTNDSCAAAVRNLQKIHQSVERFVDIGYSFMIGGDGTIYVGTGWDYRNFHRRSSIGINFLGNYVYDELTEDMITAFNELVYQGLQLNKISKNYKLIGENQTNAHKYLSPGPNVVKHMKNWPHFYNYTWF